MEEASQKKGESLIDKHSLSPISAAFLKSILKATGMIWIGTCPANMNIAFIVDRKSKKILRRYWEDNRSDWGNAHEVSDDDFLMFYSNRAMWVVPQPAAETVTLFIGHGTVQLSEVKDFVNKARWRLHGQVLRRVNHMKLAVHPKVVADAARVRAGKGATVRA